MRNEAAPFSSIDDALAWLDSHIDHELKAPSRRSLPTLDRMRELVRLLGDPEQAYPAVHLTGTNGKGSTAAMTAGLLAARGLTVGTYTSPNLSKVSERLALSGPGSPGAAAAGASPQGAEPIDDRSFAQVLESLALLEPMLGGRPTRFELLTAAAFAWFADVAVDVAVVEVGVGGTWDATNVVDAAVAVLTNVSYDHTDILGPTLEGIAADKAGIVKPGATAVIGELDPALVSIVRSVADEAGAAQVWVRGEEFDVTANRLALGGRLVDLRTPGGAYADVLVPLHGAHQGLNAVCALAAAEAFFASPLDPEVVRAGFGTVRVPGRLEVVGRHPLVLVDGAHNVAGTEVLARALVEEFSTEGPLVAAVGMLSGRDPSAMLAPLAAAGVRTLVACAPISPRAQPAEVVAEAARAAGMEVVVAGSVTDALGTAVESAGADGVVVATGSLYVVAEAREAALAQRLC